MRRKWRDAMPKGATMSTSKAAVGYDYVNKLFLLERKFAKMKNEERKNARQAMEARLLDAYWLWLKTLEPTPGSKLAEAVTYARTSKRRYAHFSSTGMWKSQTTRRKTPFVPLLLGERTGCFPTR